MPDSVQHIYEIKTAMKYLNNAEQDIIVRKNKFYDQNNNLLVEVHIPPKVKK
jgi:hypothetical protein